MNLMVLTEQQLRYSECALQKPGPPGHHLFKWSWKLKGRAGQ